MSDLPRFRFPDLFLLLFILALAGGFRALYVSVTTEDGAAAPLLVVQGPAARPAYPAGTELRGRTEPDELDALVHNLTEHRWFGSLSPLADREERTAHVAPGYPWLLGRLARWVDEPEMWMRWAQCLLGSLTAGLYFLFARRAFGNVVVAALAGLLCALHPFWIVNTAEVNDGVLATFLLGAALWLGTAAGQDGGPVPSFLFGLSLAALAMVRAALLPFAVVALLWFLLRCRGLRRGWFFALLAFLGFTNGLAPWAVRNYQAFGEAVPVADSAWWHLWVGNNPRATGGPLDDGVLRGVLPEERLRELAAEPNQPQRYRALAAEVADEVASDPQATLNRRLWAGLSFVFGEAWLREWKVSRAAEPVPTGEEREGAVRIARRLPLLLTAALLGMLVLGFLGWRWSHGWRAHGRLGTLALLWCPLPYVLSHAESLSGPRLPLDGVLLCYAAFALAAVLPAAAGGPAEAPRE